MHSMICLMQACGIPYGKLWSTNDEVDSLTCRDLVPELLPLTQTKSPFDHFGLRLWGNLPGLSRLRRPLDLRQLREALARIGWELPIKFGLIFLQYRSYDIIS